MPVDFHQWFTVHLCPDKITNLTGQKAILFGNCPMAACYFQLCKRQCQGHDWVNQKDPSNDLMCTTMPQVYTNSQDTLNPKSSQDILAAIRFI